MRRLRLGKPALGFHFAGHRLVQRRFLGGVVEAQYHRPFRHIVIDVKREFDDFAAGLRRNGGPIYCFDAPVEAPLVGQCAVLHRPGLKRERLRRRQNRARQTSNSQHTQYNRGFAPPSRRIEYHHPEPLL